MKTRKICEVIDIVCVSILILGVIFVVYQKYSGNSSQDIWIVALAAIPLLTNNIVMAFFLNEAMISGIPNAIKKDDNPELYWSIIFIYILLLTVVLLYLIKVVSG